MVAYILSMILVKTINCEYKGILRIFLILHTKFKKKNVYSTQKTRSDVPVRRRHSR